MSGRVVKVSGPLVVATGLADANMSDVVRVGPQRLIGEILTMKGDTANIQVYEETSGLGLQLEGKKLLRFFSVSASLADSVPA